MLTAGAVAAMRWARRPELGHLLCALAFVALAILLMVEGPLLPAPEPKGLAMLTEFTGVELVPLDAELAALEPVPLN